MMNCKSSPALGKAWSTLPYLLLLCLASATARHGVVTHAPPSPPAFIRLLGNETRLAIAGALAGGFSNFVLHPIDTAKTLRQSNPSAYPHSLLGTLIKQTRERGFTSIWGGLTPAVIGSMPSSALYFGVYEYMKRQLHRRFLASHHEGPAAASKGATDSSSSSSSSSSIPPSHVALRSLVHAAAAACGNTASSLIFVPKEVVKQQLQTLRNTPGTPASDLTITHVVQSLVHQRGIQGLYMGYRATLLRNIPSNILRFTLYEEFKIGIKANPWLRKVLQDHHAHIIAGGLAGAISSALTTPLDVVKTRMAINTCPPGSVVTCLVSVAQNEGMGGLYAGMGFRVIYSALFTAVGFSAFEYSKNLLGVADGGHKPPPSPSSKEEEGEGEPAWGGGGIGRLRVRK